MLGWNQFESLAAPVVQALAACGWSPCNVRAELLFEARGNCEQRGDPMGLLGLGFVDPVEPVREVAAAVRVLGHSRTYDEKGENPGVDGRGFQNRVLLRGIR
jgi:hypothetical protein